MKQRATVYYQGMACGVCKGMQYKTHARLCGKLWLPMVPEARNLVLAGVCLAGWVIRPIRSGFARRVGSPGTRDNKDTRINMQCLLVEECTRGCTGP